MHVDEQASIDPQPPSQPVPVAPAAWEAFAANLAAALKRDHDGLRAGALRMIIQHGDALSFGRATVFDVVRLYRDHEDARMRRMAVVALGRMHDAWAFDVLERSVPFETTPGVRHTLLAVLAARSHGTGGTPALAGAAR